MGEYHHNIFVAHALGPKLITALRAKRNRSRKDRTKKVPKVYIPPETQNRIENGNPYPPKISSKRNHPATSSNKPCRNKRNNQKRLQHQYTPVQYKWSKDSWKNECLPSYSMDQPKGRMKSADGNKWEGKAEAMTSVHTSGPQSRQITKRLQQCSRESANRWSRTCSTSSAV